MNDLERRLANALLALAPYDEEETALVDCLTDLMHLAKFRGKDWNALLAQAADHFNAER
jgi:hypothetical protein